MYPGDQLLTSTQGSRAKVWRPSPESAGQSSNPDCFSTLCGPGVSPLRVNEGPREPLSREAV